MVGLCSQELVQSEAGGQKPGNLQNISFEVISANGLLTFISSVSHPSGWAKPQHLGSGVCYPKGKLEPYSTPTLVQEQAKLLG